MTPYFYKLRHIPTGKYYVGSQYGKKSDPKNLLKSYITSSKKVKLLIEEYGIDSFEILKIVVRNDAREYESKFLKRLFRSFGKKIFLEKMLNRNIAPGILLTPEIIERANIKRKISMSISAKKLLEEGRHNFQLHNSSKYDHVRKLTSDRMKGNTFGNLKVMTDELKKTLSEKAKGNQNVRGTKWWYNQKTGEKKRLMDCPGSDWVNKCPITLTNESRQRIVLATSKPKSLEHRKKLSLSAKKRLTNQTHNFLKGKIDDKT